MTGPLKIPMILLASLVVALGLHAWAPQNDSEPAGDAIQMTARKYQFEPNLISVKKGEKVRLIITAQDRDHGIKIKAFGINQRLVKGRPTIVEFTAGKAGIFRFKCSVRCGLRHGKMKGKLIVEDDSA
jgi:cytochrome c oxidase subunit 2